MRIDTIISTSDALLHGAHQLVQDVGERHTGRNLGKHAPFHLDLLVQSFLRVLVLGDVAGDAEQSHGRPLGHCTQPSPRTRPSAPRRHAGGRADAPPGIRPSRCRRCALPPRRRRRCASRSSGWTKRLPSLIVVGGTLCPWMHATRASHSRSPVAISMLNAPSSAPPSASCRRSLLSCSRSLPALSAASLRRLSSNSAARTSAHSVVTTMATWAACTRSRIAVLGSPKRPMPNVVVETSATATMNAAAAANTGRQRAATHKSTGKSTAIGTNVIHEPDWRDERKCAQQGQHRERQRSFRQLAPWQRLMHELTQADDQRRDRDDAEPVRQEPDAPDARAGVRRCGRGPWRRPHRRPPSPWRGGRRQKAQHAMQAVEPERLTEPTLDQPSRHQRLSGIAKTGG